MKRIILIMAAAFLIMAAPMSAFAAMDHDHGSMKMDHDAMGHGGTASFGKQVHQEVVEGVKTTFYLLDTQKKMKEAGMKETHHLMATFTDAKTGKTLPDGEARAKVISADKTEQVKDMMAMEGGFGADITMAKKGKYGILVKFKLADGKVRSVTFWHTLK